MLFASFRTKLQPVTLSAHPQPHAATPTEHGGSAWLPRAELAAGAQLVELPRKACLMVGEKDGCPFPDFVTPALWETLKGDEQQGIVRLALCLLHEKSKGASSGYAPYRASNLAGRAERRWSGASQGEGSRSVESCLLPHPR